jgi:hypothetical protein
VLAYFDDHSMQHGTKKGKHYVFVVAEIGATLTQLLAYRQSVYNHYAEGEERLREEREKAII